MFDPFFLNSPESLFYAYQSSYDLPMVLVSVSIAIFSSFCAFEMVERLSRNTSRNFWLPMGALILGVGVWAMHFIGMLAFRLDCDVTYDPWITAASVAPGIVAAIITLNSIASDTMSIGKRILGGLSMGAGIGLMHFSGMAAIRLDGILRYDPYLFFFSLFAALALATAALFVKPWLRRLRIGCQTLLPSMVGGTILGGAISSMHYIAMEAAYFIHQHPDGDETVIVATSPILLAIIVTAVALMLVVTGILVTYLSVKIASIRNHIEAILTTTSQGFVIVDNDDIIQECNPALAKLLATDCAQLIGQSFTGLMTIPPPQELQDGYQLETVLHRFDGDDIPCMVHGNTVHDDHGTALYDFALISDISQQKQQELKILDSERRLLDILDVSPIAVRIAIHNGRKVVFFNQRYAELIGNSNALGDDPKHYYANQQDYQDVLAQLAVGNTVLNRSLELRIPGKASIWVLASYMPMRYQDSDAVLGWFYDISERIEAQNALTHQLELQQRVEDSLRQANDEQQAIFDSASSGIALIKHGLIQRYNRQLGAIFGYLPNELNEQGVECWFDQDDDSQAALRHLVNEINIGRIKRQECQLMRKNGERFWARIAGQALNRQNARNGVVIIIEDITLERAATEEILKAKNLAEEATRTKSDFLANMSHEIRTPMNAIIGFTHLMMRSELPPRQADYLKKIHASSQHLLGIINDILDFSKIEAGKMVIEHIDFDLEELLSNVSGLINEKATEKGLELVFDITPDIPLTLIGDPLRLGQVLINFATNAIKFTEKGGITISVRAIEDHEHHALLKFTVKDTGIGLNPEQIGRLFQSFQQADSSVTRKYGGTGLGLVICKNLAKIMGGEIGVESELGRGSEFWFTAKLGKGQSHHRRQLTPHPDLRGKHMLVVDDNENARTVVSDLLESMSFKVESAESGPAALQVIKRSIADDTPFDAIFVDWQMPNMDGIELAHAIQGMGLLHAPKLVLVTAYGREQVINGAIQAGFDEIILKPVNASSLFDSVARAFGKDMDADMAKSHTALPDASDLADLAGARILLVEDNEMNQQIATELLQDAGFFVDIAENGQQGIDKVKQNTYELVLMDMQMPVMDGVTATQEIRKLPNLASLPIVAMTANAMAQDRDRCLAAGMNDHLPKPIEPDDLWATLRKWIKPGLVSGPIRTVKPMTPPPTPTTDDELFNDIEGLDTRIGLRRVQGKQSLYLTMLRNFVDKQTTTPDDIREALDHGDITTAERQAHTLKGLAGNIGAAPLQTSAEHLETALRERQNAGNIDMALTDTRDLLHTLIDGLNDKLKPQTQSEIVASQDSADEPVPTEGAGTTPGNDLAPPQAVDEAALHEILSRLEVLLNDSDPEALDYFASHGELLQTSHPESFADIKQAIENFAFEEAAAYVLKLHHPPS